MDAHSSPIDEARRKAFESAWIQGEPHIEPFLPDPQDERYLGTLEELVLIDLEFRWKQLQSMARGTGRDAGDVEPSLDSYLDRFVSLRESNVLRRLIAAEYPLRCRFGTRPSASEYAQRYPQVFADEANARQFLAPINLDPSFPIGNKTSLGRYQILGLHARGGFGEVWRAYDPLLKRHVAIKTLARPLQSDPGIRKRFEAEVRTTARLEHPGIVSVHDSHTAEAEVPYYVMRMLEGETLADAIRAFHRCTDPSQLAVQRVRLLSCFLAITQTVEFAHSQGVLHRDLKPQNIILGEFGETAILDWGIAKQRMGRQEPEESSHGTDIHTPDAGDGCRPPSKPNKVDTDSGSGRDLTVLGTVMGTPAYMSPEQAAGRTDLVDELSDEYCLGGILYEILTGERPPSGGEIEKSPRLRLQEKDAVPPSSKPLLAISFKAMATDRAERYGSVSELKQDLERYLADEPVIAYAEPWSRKLSRWIKRHRTLVTTASSTLAVAALLLTTGFVLLLEANRSLSLREREAQALRKKTQDALDDAHRNLYSNHVSLAHAEISKNNVVRADQLLDECPEELRDWEWHHLKWLIQQHQPLYRLTVSGLSVAQIAYSPDGTQLATAGGDGRVLVWDTRSRSRIAEFAHGAQVRGVEFSPLGGKLASVGTTNQDGTFKGSLAVWDLATGHAIRREAIHRKLAATVAFSADGKQLFTAGNDDRISIWDSDTLELRKSLELGSRHVEHIVSYGLNAPDGPTLLFTCDRAGELSVWDVHAGKKVASVQAHSGAINGCDLDADQGRLVTAGADRLIKIWNVTELLQREEESDPMRLAPLKILAGHTDQVRSVTFSPDNRLLVSGGLDRSVRIWDLESVDCIQEIRSHTSHVQSVAFSPAGDFLASAGDDGDIQVRKADEFTRPNPTGRYVRFLPDSQRLVIASKEAAGIWNGSEMIHAASRGQGEVLCLSLSADGARCALSHRGHGLRILDTQSGANLLELNGIQGDAFCAVFSVDGTRLLSAHVDRCVRIWNVSDGKLLHVQSLPRPPYRLILTPDQGGLVVGYTDGRLARWSMEDWTMEYEVLAHDRFLSDMAIHPDGSCLATIGFDGRIKIWDWRDGSLLRSTKVGASWLNCLAFTPDGRRLVTGSEHTITFWDPADLREVLSMSLARCVHDMSFSSDGTFLALAGEDPAIRIWHGGAQKR